MTKLTLDVLAKGLGQFQDRYHALDVFIDDVPELAKRTENDFTVGADGKQLHVRMYRELGVARVMTSRANADGSTLAGGLAGAAAGAAFARPSGRGEGAVIGFLAGMLVGALLGTPSSGARRVLAVRYDPATRQWVGYDGGLVPLMKQKLAHPDVTSDLPTSPPSPAS